jgi:hypothetical protein
MIGLMKVFLSCNQENMMETIIALKPANEDDYKKALEELRKNSLRR